MKAVMSIICIGLLAITSSAQSQTRVPADSTAVIADTTLVFTLELGSRLYPEWNEEVSVRLHEDFYLGDTEYLAAVRGFMPDFRMWDGRAVNYSVTMNNPAAFVAVFADTGVTESTWAFLNFPPHYSASSFFTFKLLNIDGYVEPDSMVDVKE